MKRQTKIKEPYLIRFRIKSKIGIWGPWEGSGEAEWIGLHHAQSQIATIKKALASKTIEIEFTKSGVRLDYNGNETDKKLIYETRQ